MSYSVRDQAYSAIGREVADAKLAAAFGQPTPISADATVIELRPARHRSTAPRFASLDCVNNYHENCIGCSCTCHEEAKAA